jgi:uncharacterized membrane protein HdeD (DUF308 family)
MPVSRPLSFIGIFISLVTVVNIISAFRMQCTQDEYARTIHKLNLLFGGLILASGTYVAYLGFSEDVDKHNFILPIASSFLLVQSILSLTGTDGQEADCTDGWAVGANIIGLFTAVGGLGVHFDVFSKLKALRR